MGVRCLGWMSMTAYYNEIDPYAAEWLRRLIAAGHITDGIVDERSIEDVSPDELVGFTQCHFFAGIGGWSYALRLAGWPDDKPVWTGSCPCQPYSQAGAGGGFDDERHLWPAFFKLIATCKPDIIFGEQVASSEVMGNADEGLYGLRGGQTPGSVSSIYRAREIWSPPSLQDMPKRIRKEMALKFKRIQEETEREKGGKSEGLLSGVSIRKQGKISSLGMQASLFEEGDTVRSRYLSEGDSGKDKCGCVRSVGCESGLDSFGGEAIQHSVNRSDSARRGVCLQKHTDNSICRECDDGRLGRESGARDNAIVDSEEGLKNDERRTTRENNKKPYGETEPSWIDAVFDDLEGSGYACAAVAFPSASVGAPHIRQRLFWVADSQSERQEWREDPAGKAGRSVPESDRGGMAITHSWECQRLADGERCIYNGAQAGWEQGHCQPEHGCASSRLPNTAGERLPETRTNSGRPQERSAWAGAEWIDCADGKRRRIEPGLSPLAYGISGRVVISLSDKQTGATVSHSYNRSAALTGFGNAIVPEIAAEFIAAFAWPG